MPDPSSLPSSLFWQPGKNLEKFLAGNFGIPPREQAALVEKIGDAVSETAPLVRQAMEDHPGFREIGKHLLNAWQEGVSDLRNKRTYALGDWKPSEAFCGFSDPPKLKAPSPTSRARNRSKRRT